MQILSSPINPDKFSAKGLEILKKEFGFLKQIYKKNIELKIFLNKFSGNTILSDKAINLIMSNPAKCTKSVTNGILDLAKRFQMLPT